MLAIWGAVFVLAAASYPHLMNNLAASDYSVNGSDSQRVTQLLESDFSAAGAEQDVVAFDSNTLTINDPAYAQVVNRVVAGLRAHEGVVYVLGPADPGAQGQVSKDQHAALASLGLSGNDRERADLATDLQDVVKNAAGNGTVNAYLTGYSPVANDMTEVENADLERAESIGIPIAFIVLLVALAAVVAACVPLITALVGLTFTFGVLALMSGIVNVDGFLLTIVTMIGVGIAIDYSLFIVTRFREELARGRREGRADAIENAAGKAMVTSGRTILFSGTIVMISLFALYAVDAPLFHGMALGAVLVVACTLITAWTMLPALLAALGPRVNKWALPKRWQPAEDVGASDRQHPNGWARWARTVLRRPWLAIPALALLVVFALPTFSIKLGLDMGLAAMSDTPSGKGDIILSESFSPGVLSPVQIVASHQGSGALNQSDLTAIDNLTTALSKDPRVADVYSIATLTRDATGQVTPQAMAAVAQNPATKTFADQTVNVAEGSDRTIITVISAAPIDSTEATDLVKEIRDTTIPANTTANGPDMLVGGMTAQFVDLSDETMRALPIVMIFVLGLSFLYLMVVFRSLLIPFKAVLMNLLATGAAFGLTTWVFAEGHLEGLFDFTSVGFLQVYLPIITFALLFGLSMDYEVFLISRMHEQWEKTHDNDDAVATGVARTARSITAAALIMTAVFGCFIVADVLELKQFGFALAVAVLLDATLVRLLLVPAFMKVAGGKANWWLPRWLQRILPRVKLE